MSSTTDKIKGAANQAMGQAKQEAGRDLGSDRLQTDGLAQEAKGRAQRAVGDAKKAAEDAADVADTAARTRGDD